MIIIKLAFVSGGSGEDSERDDYAFVPDASLINVGSATVYGLYNAAKSEFFKHPNLKISQLRIFIWVRKQADSTFEPDKATHEVGNDFVGRFAVKIAENHRGGLIRLRTRAEAEEELQNI